MRLKRVGRTALLQGKATPLSDQTALLQCKERGIEIRSNSFVAMQRKRSRNSLEQRCDKAKQLLSQIKQLCDKAKKAFYKFARTALLQGKATPLSDQTALWQGKESVLDFVTRQRNSSLRSNSIVAMQTKPSRNSLEQLCYKAKRAFYKSARTALLQSEATPLSHQTALLLCKERLLEIRSNSIMAMQRKLSTNPLVLKDDPKL
jgi:hypothetical protein